MQEKYYRDGGGGGEFTEYKWTVKVVGRGG